MAGIAGQTLSYAIAIIFVRLQGFILLPFIARYVAKEDLSVFDILFGYGTLISMISMAGMDTSMATLYRHPEHEEEKRELVGSAVGIVAVTAGLGALLLFSITGLIETHVFGGRQSLSVETGLVGGLIVVTCLQSVLSNILRQEFLLKKYNVAVIGGGLFSFAVTLGTVVFLGWGIRGMLAALVGTGILKTMLLAWWATPWMRWTISGKLVRRLLAIGIPMLPVSVCAWFMAGFDRTLLQMWRSPGEVADYGMAYRFALAGTVVTGAFQSAWWPYAMSRAWEPGVSRHFQQICRIYCVGGAFLAAGIAIASPIITWLVLPEDFAQCFQSAGMQSLRNVVHVYYYFPLVSLLAAKKTASAVKGYFIGMLVTVGLNLLLVRPLGIGGCVIASLIGFLTMAGIVGRLGRREFNFGYPVERIEGFFLGCGLALTLWLWVPIQSIGKVAIVGAFTMIGIAGAAYFFGIVKKEDWTFGRERVRMWLRRRIVGPRTQSK